MHLAVVACLIFYADDTMFFTGHFYLLTLESITETILSQASICFRANSFMLNESKTQHITFSLSVLPDDSGRSCVKLLGLMVDNNMTWEFHIN